VIDIANHTKTIVCFYIKMLTFRLPERQASSEQKRGATNPCNIG